MTALHPNPTQYNSRVPLSQNQQQGVSCNMLHVGIVQKFTGAQGMEALAQVRTSMTGPLRPPMRWSSSTMKSAMFCTFLRCFQRRLSMSHFSGVEIMMLPLSSALVSAAVSPISSTTLRPSPSGPNCAKPCTVSNWACQGAKQEQHPRSSGQQRSLPCHLAQKGC